MASSISFSGLASGIDSSALIKSLLDQQRKAKITPYQTKVSILEDTDSSLSELKDLLEKLKSSADKFRVINGGALSKTSSSSNETIIEADASNSAANGTYSISVSALAKNATSSFNDRFSSSSQTINSSINNAAAAVDRTVSVSIGTGSNQETVDVTLTNSSTLTDFVNAFNSNADKAEAAIVNVGTSSSPSYAVVISSNQSGTEQGQLAVTVGAEISSAGSGAFSSSTLSQATDATFSVSGINGTLTRSTNSVSDVITGLSLNFQSVGAATLKVTDDTQASTQTVQDFVDAYNEVVKYVAEHDTITRDDSSGETQNIFGPLAHTSVDENILSGLRSALSSSGISGGLLNSFSELGISTQRDGTLSLDTTKFSTALSTDSASVSQILQNLGDRLAAVDGTIAQFTQFNGLIDQTLNANKQQISDYQNRISDVEKNLSKEQEALNARFARLESIMGQLNSQQNALSALLK